MVTVSTSISGLARRPAVAPAGEQARTDHRTYHHGNLAEALTEAGVDLARTGGPEAVVLREAARRVGVSPTAAYRHFAGQGALVETVKERALEVLSERMTGSLAALDPIPASESGAGGPELGVAIRRLRAIGEAYLHFALTEPGLFRMFCIGLPMPEGVHLDDGTAAFGVLSEVMGELCAAAAIDPDRAPSCALSAWSAVHGLAMLCLDGPLAELTDDARQALAGTTLDMVLYGLVGRR